MATSSALCLTSSSCLRRSFFVALAGLCRHALGALDRGALLADLGVFFGDLALFRLAQAGVAERVRAAVPLFIGQRVQHHAGRLRRRCGRRGRCGSGRRRGAALPGYLALVRRGGRRRLGLGGRLARGAPAADLLDDDRLGPAMAEALAHDPRLAATRLKRQRLGRGDTQLLIASFFSRFSHSVSISRALAGRSRPFRSEIVQGASSASEPPYFRDRQAAQHVPHLTGPMPNPIAPR